MADSLFYYPMTLHRGTITAPVLAPFVKNLPPVSGVVEEIYVRTQDTNPAGQSVSSVYTAASVRGIQGDQGVFVWDASDKRFRFVMPYTEVCQAVISGATINVYYDIEAAGPTIPSGATVYRNGVAYTGTDFTIGDNAVWSVLTFPASGSGDVKTVNGNSPDANGNVTINTGVLSVEDGHSTTGDSLIVDPGTTTGVALLKTILAGANITITPDGSGENLTIAASVPAATATTLGLVKPGSGLSVAGDGTLTVTYQYTLPVATTTILGGVKQGNGVTIAGDGTISANVLSVNGRTGAITLTATDVGLPTDLLGGTGGTLNSTYVPAYLLGAVNYQGAWNASTNTPSITTGSASSANKGYYYVVSVAGTTTVDGISTWNVGDWIISNGVVWSRVPVNQTVVSVSGQTGAVVIQASNNNAATGTTLISDSGSTTGNIKLKTIVAGTNISLASDANGNLVVNNTLSGSGITQVASVGTGNSLVAADGTSGGIAQIKSIAAGSNITITPDAQNQTYTITANQVITPATTTTIGGVIVGAGLGVIANGTISLAAPTGANLGGVKAGTGISIDSSGVISVTAVGGVTSVSGQTGAVVVSAVDTSTASGTSLITASGATTGTINIRRLVAGTGITLATDGNNNLTITSTGGYTLPAATTSTLGGVIVGTGLSVTAGGTLSVTSPGGVTSITAGTSGALTGALTFTAGQSISLSNTGNSIQISGTGVPEAPNDGNLYGRENMGWVQIPAVGSAITSLTSDTTAGSVSILETQPNVNTAITKSLTAGSNVTFTDNGSNIIIAASIPAGTVSTVNSVSPNSSGNVTLTAANVNALPIAGGTMSGAINMGAQTLTNLVTPVNASDAVPLSYLQTLTIDNGTF